MASSRNSYYAPNAGARKPGDRGPSPWQRRVKESRGTRFVILEGGINHLLRPLLTGQPFPVKAIGKAGSTRPATLAGPLCTSLDRLGEVELPELAPGDLLAFGMTGACGFTEAMTPFLSHEPAREVWVT